MSNHKATIVQNEVLGLMEHAFRDLDAHVIADFAKRLEWVSTPRLPDPCELLTEEKRIAYAKHIGFTAVALTLNAIVKRRTKPSENIQ